MSDIFSRDYVNEDDYTLMRQLLRSAYAIVGPDVAMTIGDLDYWRFQSPDADAEMRSCRLWLDGDGALAGFAWPGCVEDGAGVIDLFAHPRHGHMLDPMLEWAEHWHSKRAPGRSITTIGFDTDDHMTVVLTRRGYARTESFSHWYRVRPLDQPIPEGAVADGYRLRSAERGDAAAIVEVNNQSGAGPALTTASCGAIMDAPTYRPELHLVAEVLGEPEIAAFCIVWYDEVNFAGLFEPVACHPAHHRRGLATAMISDGLRRLRRLGATHALVATSGSNEPANRLYASLGFKPGRLGWEWTKKA
ncbi:MAG: GNAT family N-acetyltransferase [Planctomycetes bacterium]|nr:GNAT family N-acetyltransferase [Planctomycetota bacterium]